MRSSLVLGSLACLCACSPAEGGNALVGECPALGNELLPGLPLPGNAPEDSCPEDDSWPFEVGELEAALSVELQRDDEQRDPAIAWTDAGPVVAIGDELLGLDPDGAERWRQPYNPNRRVDDSRIVATGDRIYLADDFGDDAKIVSFDASTGQQLDQFFVSHPDEQGVPNLALDGDSLWLSYWVATDGNPSFVIERYSLAGDGPFDSVSFFSPGLREPDALAVTDAGVLGMVSHDTLARVDVATASYTWERPIAAYSRAVLVPIDARLVLAHANSDGDWAVSSYVAETGELEWQRTVGREDSNDPELAALPDGGVALVAGDRLDPHPSLSSTSYEQPMIVTLDAAGELVAGERLAVQGAALGAALSPRGELYVVGSANISWPWEDDFVQVQWLRRYDLLP